MLTYIWLAVFVVMLIIEGIGPGLICLWFAFGALIAFVFSLFNSTLIIQLIAFFVSSALFVILFRPIALRYINQKKVATNADMVINHDGIVIEEINETLGTGQIKILGQVWSAKAQNGEMLPIDTQVKVLRIEGAKAIVKQIE